MSGGGQTSTSTQTSGPPSYLAPFIQYGANQAAQIYQSPSPAYYPGSTIANRSPASQAGYQAAIAQGLHGDPALQAAGSYLANAAGGKYLGGQSLDPIHRSLAAAIIPQVDAQFSLAGRYGSSDQAGSLTTALANAYAPYDYGNYQAERQLQQSAAGMAPAINAADWQNIQGLQQAGAGQDQFEQNRLNADIGRWNYDQNLAQSKLQQYMGLLLNPGFGTQGTTTQAQPSGGIGGFLGGLLGGIL
jgi:hypothetical protein